MTMKIDLSRLPLKAVLSGGERLSVKLPLNQLSRLADTLQDDRGDLCVGIQVRKRPGSENLLLDLDVEGELGIDCQRCLETYYAPFRAQRILLVERSNDEMPMDSDEDYERVSADFTWCLDLKAVITDEILLGMPRAHPKGCLDTTMAKYMVDTLEGATEDLIGR